MSRPAAERKTATVNVENLISFKYTVRAIMAPSKQ
jgi:hypothetical protein